MLRLVDTAMLRGTSVELLVFSPSGPLGENSFREVHFEWDGNYYTASFILAQNARNPVDFKNAPCGCEGGRIHVRDFELSSLYRAIDYILANKNMMRCLQVSSPIDSKSVWVGVPPVDSRLISAEQREEGKYKIHNYLLLALQQAVGFGLVEPDEEKLLDWIREQCKELINQHRAYDATS